MDYFISMWGEGDIHTYISDMLKGLSLITPIIVFFMMINNEERDSKIKELERNLNALERQIDTLEDRIYEDDE